MRTDLVVVFHVRQQYVTEMPLAEHNNMVKALPSDRTDESLSKSVLPWGTWRRRSIANAHWSKSSDEELTKDPVPIADQLAGSLFPAACFRELICHPLVVDPSRTDYLTAVD